MSFGFVRRITKSGICRLRRSNKETADAVYVAPLYDGVFTKKERDTLRSFGIQWSPLRPAPNGSPIGEGYERNRFHHRHTVRLRFRRADCAGAFIHSGVLRMSDDGFLKGSTEPPYCCHACADEMTANLRKMKIEPPNRIFSSVAMILCSECGNKRCPKASNHTLECTHSNEPGQPGSIYR